MIKGQREFKISENIKIGQAENGMHWVEIRDDDGLIDMILTAKTSNELYKRLEEYKGGY